MKEQLLKSNLGQMKDLGRSLQRKSTMAVLITAAILIELTSLVQYFYARKGIREEVEHRAHSELQAKNLEIRNVMTSIAVAAENMSWVVEQNLGRPDSVYGILQEMVKRNPDMVGASIGFAENFYPQHGRWFEPYVLRTHNGDFKRAQIGNSGHNYFEMEWYKQALGGKGYWTEPYFDEAGAHMMLCTYSYPIHDAQGNVVAVMGADVSLDWLSDLINAKPIYKSSFNMMISREGQIIASPVESLVMKESSQQMSIRMKDTTIRSVNRRMLAGESGQAVVTDDEGEKNFVFFAPVEGETGWSMAVVCKAEEVYYSLKQVSFNLFLLMLLGLALLGYIVVRTARGYHRLQEVSESKATMESELNVANNIQMSMLPKIFPPFPERDDIEVYGQVAPAKAVGGDIYDFFIRDEKLFFCVGDVSGKGVPAALVMAVTRALFRNISSHESLPDHVMTAMNEALSEDNESNMFVTMFVGVLDLPTGRLRTCNAGHEVPLLMGREVVQMDVDANIPLGVLRDWKYTSQEQIIDPQTTIFLFTDGLTEAEDFEHRLFGHERMMDVARQTLEGGRAEPTVLLARMEGAVHSFVAGAEQSDDLTMLAIRYTKEQRDIRLKREITLPNDIQTVPRLTQFVDEVCEALDFDASATMQINLALEEAVVNVMNYAYPPGTEGEVNIEAQANDVRLKFTITDSGKPFDPTTNAEVDTSLPAEQRPIGGLGIFLVREIMDSLNYERLGGKNVLTIRKKLT